MSLKALHGSPRRPAPPPGLGHSASLPLPPRCSGGDAADAGPAGSRPEASQALPQPRQGTPARGRGFGRSMSHAPDGKDAQQRTPGLFPKGRGPYSRSKGYAAGSDAATNGAAAAAEPDLAERIGRKGAGQTSEVQVDGFSGFQTIPLDEVCRHRLRGHPSAAYPFRPYEQRMHQKQASNLLV